MVDGVLDSDLMVLLYGQWGPARSDIVPLNGFLGLRHHNVETPAYTPGTVVRRYNDTLGVLGWSEFVYLRVVANAGVAVAAKQVCVQDRLADPYTVTNDPDDAVVLAAALPQLRGAYALSALTTLYYGWFWCGGVVPETAVPTLGGNFPTDGTVAAGRTFSVANLAADAIGIGLYVNQGTTPTGGRIFGTADTIDT